MAFVHSRSRVITPQAFRAAMPLDTHWGRRLSCAQAECAAYANPTGWRTWAEPGSSEEGVIRQHIKRRGWRHAEEQEGGRIVFIFPGGTPCFQDGRHRAQLEREANLAHIDKESRRVTPMARQSWHDRWAEHLDRLSRLRGE